MAQKISGDLSLMYQEIPCNDSLPQKLKEANDSDVVTVLFGDPDSLSEETFARPMRQYDLQYLLNCAALLAWEPWAKDGIESDRRWIDIKTKVFKQKAGQDPPRHHEWRSIFSRDDLELRTRMLIVEIQSGLMKQLMSDPTKARRAEDLGTSQRAAALGIETASLPHLEGPSE